MQASGSERKPKLERHASPLMPVTTPQAGGRSIPDGTQVRLSGLRRSELNGHSGMVCSYDEAKGRYVVRLDADLLKCKALLPANLQIIFGSEAAPVEAEAEEEDDDHSVDEADEADEAVPEVGEDDASTEAEADMSDTDEMAEVVRGGRKSGRRAMMVAQSDSEEDDLPDLPDLPDDLQDDELPAAVAWRPPGRGGHSKESPMELSDDDDDDDDAADGPSASRRSRPHTSLAPLPGPSGGEALDYLPGTITERTLVSDDEEGSASGSDCGTDAWLHEGKEKRRRLAERDLR